MKLSEVKASYTVDKIADAQKDPWAHYVARPLSYYPAWLCIKLGISANATTIVGLLIGISGCALMAYGYMMWGAILVNLYGLSDYVDGDIARATKTQSEYGGRLDGLSYLVITAFLFMSIGIGLNSPNVVMLGVGASFIRIFRFAITYQAQIPSESGKSNLLIRAGMAIIGVREPLLLICAIAGYLDIFIYFYFVINTLELLAVMLKIVRR